MATSSSSSTTRRSSSRSSDPSREAGAERERHLVARARSGEREALEALLEPWRKRLFAFVYRMVTHRDDAEDLLQEAFVRAIAEIGSFRGDAPFQTWLFGIASHVCLDHLRKKTRWRVETQLEGEARARADPKRMEEIQAMMSRGDFAFEIREHVAFCFSCLARSLEPEAQAALFLREVMGFTTEEGAAMLGLSEPKFRHRLAAARRFMIDAFDGMCQLINKTGACWQCRGLREIAPESNRGPNLVQIEAAPGVTVTPESLFEARLEIVRAADLEGGHSRKLHEDFFDAVSQWEDARPV